MSMLCPQDVKLLIEDLGELKPTIFCAVPRVLDRVYTGSFNHFLYSVLNISSTTYNASYLQ